MLNSLDDWESLHRARPWGKWPDMGVARWVLGNFAHLDDHKRLNTRMLDLGCGAGSNLYFLIAECFDAVGVDGSHTACAAARARVAPLVEARTISDGVPMREVVVAEANIVAMPQVPDAYYHVVIDCCTLQHLSIDDAHRALDEIHRVLRPGGRLLSITAAADCPAEVSALEFRTIAAYDIPRLYNGDGFRVDRINAIAHVTGGGLRATFYQVETTKLPE